MVATYGPKRFAFLFSTLSRAFLNRQFFDKHAQHINWDAVDVVLSLLMLLCESRVLVVLHFEVQSLVSLIGRTMHFHSLSLF